MVTAALARLGSALRRAVRPTVRPSARGGSDRPAQPGARGQADRVAPPRSYPGDYDGVPVMHYAPVPDGRPQPGEIVWTWVPYEEDHRRGKDRPVLLVGEDGPWLLGLPLTSKDHDRDAVAERRAGRRWLDIGAGPWDARRRPSEVRVNRVVRVDPDGVRREGATPDQETFERVAAEVRAAGR